MIYEANELDLLEASCLPQQQPILCIHLVLSSAIDTTRLYHALLHLVAMVPQLGCCFDQKHNEWRSLALCQSMLIQEVNEFDFSCWDLRKDPQIMVQIEKDPHHMALGFSHILTDANGAIQLMNLLCEAYSGIFNKVQNQRTLSNLMWNKVDGKKGKKKKRYPLVIKRQPDMGNGVVCCRVFDLALIKRIACQTKTTVNDILMCAFVQTLYSITKQSNISLSVPVNLRQFLLECPPLTVTNFVGDYTVTLMDIEHKTWRDILDEIHTQMRKERNENRQMRMLLPLQHCYRILPKPLCVWMAKQAYRTPSVSLTNPGVLSDAHLKFGEVDVVHAYVVSRIHRYPAIQITVSSFEKQCTLACHVDGKKEEMEAVHKILSNMEGCLCHYETDSKR